MPEKTKSQRSPCFNSFRGITCEGYTHRQTDTAYDFANKHETVHSQCWSDSIQTFENCSQMMPWRDHVRLTLIVLSLTLSNSNSTNTGVTLMGTFCYSITSISIANLHFLNWSTSNARLMQLCVIRAVIVICTLFWDCQCLSQSFRTPLCLSSLTFAVWAITYTSVQRGNETYAFGPLLD